MSPAEPGPVSLADSANGSASGVALPPGGPSPAAKLKAASLALWVAADLAHLALRAPSPEALAKGLVRALNRLADAQAYLAWLELDELTRAAERAPQAPPDDHRHPQGEPKGPPGHPGACQGEANR